MIRAELTVAAIALAAAIAVALDGTSAQAETQTASPESTVWDHNGSPLHRLADDVMRSSPHRSLAEQIRGLTLAHRQPAFVRRVTRNGCMLAFRFTSASPLVRPTV
jgi:hypothetical protein